MYIIISLIFRQTQKMFIPIGKKATTSNNCAKTPEDECEHGEDEEEENADEEIEEDEEESEVVEEDEENNGISPQELASLRKKMSTLPMSKLAELKGELGDALFNKALYGESSASAEKANDKTKAKPSSSSHGNLAKIVIKKNAKRPREESSKRPPPKLRSIKGVADKMKKAKNACWDPRFSTASGEFDEVAFHRDYAFLDDLRQQDIRELQKEFKKAKREQNSMAAERIRLNLRRLQNQQKSTDDQRMMEKIRAELRQSNIKRMNKGLPAVYLNNYELKQRLLERKKQNDGGKTETAAEEEKAPREKKRQRIEKMKN